jgi:hypothetical protein
MATEIIQTGIDSIDQDVLTTAAPVQGENTVPVQINPYAGIAAEAFTAEQAAILLDKIAESDIEVRPDGLIYLPEIRYRRILNRTFGPGAWALMPRSIDIGDNMLFYRGVLFIHGRFVSEAIGEQQYFPNNDRMSYATAAEAAKSNCLVRCCKDIGIASELWDPTFTRQWLAKNAVDVWCVNRQDPQKRKKFWRKVTAPAIDMWPWQEMEDSAPARDRARASEPRSEGRGAASAKNETAVAEKASEAQPGSMPAPMGGPFGDKRLISPKQAGRFRAISRVHNWKERELQRLLAQHRFATVEEITRDAYEELCSILIDEAQLATIRRKIDSEESADDVLEGLFK